MDELYKYGSDLVISLSQNPCPETLKKLFNIRTSYWKYPYQEVECGAISTFGDLKLKPPEAFSLIPAAVDICLKQTEPELIGTSSFLLLHIIEISNTTELHGYLETNWHCLIDHLNNAEPNDREIKYAIDGLQRWYRKK